LTGRNHRPVNLFLTKLGSRAYSASVAGSTDPALRARSSRDGIIEPEECAAAIHRKVEAGMDTEQLKALQAPLKQKYGEQPASALITLKARARIGEGISCKVETGKALVEAGLHPATGGDGLFVCSGDMLLEALIACAGVTLRAVSTALGIELRDAIISAEGDLDFRGTLAVAKDAPVGFKQIRLRFDLESDATEQQLASLIQLTERYCVVYQTLAKAPEIAVSYRVT
jgi:uncharacterized OsmC-like protein